VRCVSYPKHAWESGNSISTAIAARPFGEETSPTTEPVNGVVGDVVGGVQTGENRRYTGRWPQAR
jgi:hypothetical protein